MLDNPDRDMKYKKILFTFEYRLLRAAGETETTEKNIQDWLELDEGDSGFQLLTEEQITVVTSFYLFSSVLPMLLNFSFSIVF
jgi:hypothetical protein